MHTTVTLRPATVWKSNRATAYRRANRRRRAR
jgi:hypothetical protein